MTNDYQQMEIIKHNEYNRLILHTHSSPIQYYNYNTHLYNIHTHSTLLQLQTHTHTHTLKQTITTTLSLLWSACAKCSPHIPCQLFCPR